MRVISGARALAGAATCGLLAACSTGAVSDVEPTSATLHGTVETRDVPASYLFQYATRTADLGRSTGASTPRRELAANTALREVAEPIGGLAPDTTYAYRLCGRVSGATSDSCLATRRFTTPAVGSRSVTFDQPGVHAFTVPDGVTELGVLAVGAGGGAGYDPGASFAAKRAVGSPGGLGGSAQTTIAVTPGAALEVRVGSQGGDATAVGSIFPGAGGKGGTNGVDRGGNGGSGNGPTVAFFLSGSGGGGGGAPTLVIGDLFGSRSVLVGGGAGGGGGGGGDTGGPAVGGDGGRPAGQGTDGARSNPKAPYSLGGGLGSGGLGGGQDPVGASGGDGGSDTTPDTLRNDALPFSCGVDARSGAGGGGTGRARYVVERFDRCLDVIDAFDGASAGGGGASIGQSFPQTPIYGNGVESGDGFATLTWVPTD